MSDFDWEDPGVVERNTVPPHVPLVPYATDDDVLADDRASSDAFLDLGGEWAFDWAPTFAEAPDGFADPDRSVADWDAIPVPSNWQFEGYDHPVYRNVAHPFPSDPPNTPEYAPVGSYRRTFEVPDDWDGRRVFLNFEGAKSAVEVWVNGERVGYSQGSFTTAEFDVTTHLRAGENTLAVRVHRFSDGTYLEDQDMWRFSGIFRDVFLLARPATRVHDLDIATTFGDGANAALSVDATLWNETSEAVDASLDVRVYGPVGPESGSGSDWGDAEPVGEERTVSVEVPAEGTATATVEQSVDDPARWSAESPDLYAVVAELRADGSGETVGDRFGFRSVAVDDAGAIRINGERVNFNGVNRHEHHHARGRAVGPDWGRREIAEMKRYNVDTVRTSHYPPRPDFLDLTDEYGLYVVDEISDEAHANQELSEDDDWCDAYCHRGRRAVERDKNHPSVVIWSAGNEAGSGENIAEVIATGREIAPDRPWLYGGNEERLDFEDVVGPRYPTPSELADLAADETETRPSFMDEYAGATGNSMGHLEEYWELIREHPQLTGGAIWQWANHEVELPLAAVPDESGTTDEALVLGDPDVVEGRGGRGGALSLSGHDEWVEAYRHPAHDPTDALTVAAWVRPDDFRVANPLVTKGDQWGLTQDGPDDLAFYVRTGEQAAVDSGTPDNYLEQTGERVAASAPVPDDWTDGWHHVAGVFDGTELRLYVDGERVATTGYEGTLDVGHRPVAVGRNYDRHRMNHAGPISNATFDAVTVRDDALDDAAVRALADNGAGGTDASADGASRDDAEVLRLTFDAVEDHGTHRSYGIDPFTVNGIVFTDGEAKPGVPQVAKTGQPVGIELADGATDGSAGAADADADSADPATGDAVAVRVTNRHAFSDLSGYDVTWTLRADDDVVADGALDVAAAPGESATVAVEGAADVASPRPGREYRLDVSVALAEERRWAPAGHEVAWAQLDLPVEASAQPRVPADAAAASADGEPSVAASDDALVVEAGDATVGVGADAGTLDTLAVDGRSVLAEGPQFDPWRAPTRSEVNFWGRAIAEDWRQYGLDRLAREVVGFDANTDGPGVAGATVRTRQTAPGGATAFSCETRYEVLSGGDVLVGYRVTPGENLPDWLPKSGLAFALPDAFDRFSWYGRGPFETYPDRKTGARVGRYEGSVDDQYTPYVRPQTYGNKTDVRWAALTDDDGAGLVLTGPAPTNVTARRHATGDLDRANYRHQLTRTDDVRVSVDAAVTGVGGAPVITLPKYRIEPRTREAVVALRPCRGADDPADLGRWSPSNSLVDGLLDTLSGPE